MGRSRDSERWGDKEINRYSTPNKDTDVNRERERERERERLYIYIYNSEDKQMEIQREIRSRRKDVEIK